MSDQKGKNTNRHPILPPASHRPQVRDDSDIRSFFDNAVEGMFRKSRSGTFVLVNQAMAQIFGYPSPGTMLQHFPADKEKVLMDAQRFMYMLEELKSNGQISNFELQFRRRDGLLVWVLINARAVYTSKGSIKYYEGTLVDITSRKEVETQQALIEEQIRQSQKMEAVSILAGGMAADLSSLLHPILHHTANALSMTPENSPARAELDQILLAGNRTKALINKFLAISRKREGEKRPASFTTLTAEVLDDLLVTLPERIALEEDLAAQPDTILADPSALRQAIENILSNSVQSITAEGTISVTLRNVEIDERTTAFRADLAPGQYVRLTIQDTGHGIPDEALDRIFDPFFSFSPQPNDTTANCSMHDSSAPTKTSHSPHKNQGLGLSVAHGIARAHDGGITVLSESDLGSTFCLYIPSHALEVDQSQPLAPSPRLGSERILIVDPDPREQRKWKGLLAPLGYRVESASGSVEGLRAFMDAQNRVDLVVTAYAMPQMNGLELTRTLRGIRPDTQVILCKHSEDPVTPDTAHNAGLCAVARKPLESNTILRLLEEAFEHPRK